MVYAVAITADALGCGQSTLEDDDLRYNAYIQEMRLKQYPMLEDALFLDHAGTTLTSKLLMDRFHKEMVSNLYGNPHSFSQAAHRTSECIEQVRLKLLAFLKADPLDFDVVFTANATAAIKLVVEAFRDSDAEFEYCYHNESHTSLVGGRELAASARCFSSDKEVESWLEERSLADHLPSSSRTLFAYPAQSNLNGRRLPLTWCDKIQQLRTGQGRHTWSLLDAAAYVSTAPLDLSDHRTAPDFTAMSLYKIFGFPDLGALIVRRLSADVLNQRKYFGGGTVDMVVNPSDDLKNSHSTATHARKTTSSHETLEDGTLPYHSIIALDCAMTTHAELFESLERVSRHTQFLARRLFDGLAKMKHANNRPATKVYNDAAAMKNGCGPVVAFNLLDKTGDYISLHEFEKLAFARNVNVRTGGHCNPGGTASYLNLTPDQIRNHHKSGHRCGGELDLVDGMPTGMIRASLGAMSTVSDVDRFLSFLDEFYVDREVKSDYTDRNHSDQAHLCVESLTVYPIKSCAGWAVPDNMTWEIRSVGLAWDREWCVVHAITEKALSQKRNPKMALIRPELDLTNKILRVRGIHASTQKSLSITIPLEATPASSGSKPFDVGEVCGEACELSLYQCSTINSFFTDCIGVPCRLARFPDPTSSLSRRHAKDHLGRGLQGLPRSIAFSNESAILTITRASLDRLNETIKQRHGKAASPAVFRANIVLGDAESRETAVATPYAEDNWTGMSIGGARFDFLGGCRRCQMVCIDQTSAERNAEPFSTLAKTRRVNGRVLFGVHTALAGGETDVVTVRVGASVAVYQAEQEQS